MISVDTIKIKIQLKHEEELAFKSRFFPYFLGTKFKPTGKAFCSSESFQLITPEQSENYTSANPTILFYFFEDYVIFEFSAPKLIYGQNFLMFWNLEKLLKAFRIYLIKASGVELLPYTDWLLSRIDVSLNFLLDKPRYVEDAIELLSKMRYRNKPSHSPKYAYWPSQVRTIKIYGKYKEMKKHKSDYGSDFLLKHQTYLSSILRYEEEWKQKHLQKLLCVESVRDLTVWRLLRYIKNSYSLEEHLKWIGKTFSVKKRTIEIAKTLKKIDAEMARPSIYRNFVALVADKGIDEVRKLISSSTFYNRKKGLKTIGIDIMLIHEEFYRPFEEKLSFAGKIFTQERLINQVEDQIPKDLILPTDSIRREIREVYRTI